ncbi:glutaredoxin family protein [Paenibacillus elgii]|uniref:glutaredoxin family protein n=1 Tax=Paenibacillus elgii TaxID=189691 RepID=UPI0024152AAC|nr:glutaredoxin family protein [Paenibacillus elgii]
MKEPVKIYSIPTCSDCNYAKRTSKSTRLPIQIITAKKNVKYAEEVWNLTGKQIVPTIVIGDKVFVGFAENLSEIRELLS